MEDFNHCLEQLQHINLNDDIGKDLVKPPSDIPKPEPCECIHRKCIPILLPLPLPEYPPKQEVVKAKKAGVKPAMLDELNEYFRVYRETGEQVLNINNMCEVFRWLVQFEDVEELEIYATLKLHGVKMSSFHNDITLAIPNDVHKNADEVIIPDLDDVIILAKGTLASYTLQSRSEPLSDIDMLFECTRNKNKPLFIRSVKKIEKNCVHFSDRGMRRDDLITADDLKCSYDVIFRPRRVPMRYQCRALDILDGSPDVRHYLFPTRTPPSANTGQVDQTSNANASVKFINAAIAENPEQMQAVQQIVFGADPTMPYLIYGPPGTGKTTTIIEIILQLLLNQPNSCILVTSGSNTACDTIALRILNLLQHDGQLSARLKRPDSISNKVLFRVYSKSVGKKLKDIHKSVLSNSNWDCGEYARPESTQLQSYGIIVATLCAVGTIASAIKGLDFFTHCFIDEAAAVTEPEALIAICGISSCRATTTTTTPICGSPPSCRIILCGDHKQLGPVLHASATAELGLQQSLLERLMKLDLYRIDEQGNYNARLLTRLRRNYRSHPAIVGLYNHLYYDNELVAVGVPKSLPSFANLPMLANDDFPIIFQAVFGKMGKDDEGASASTRNDFEINQIMWYLRRLISHGGPHLCGADIGIVTPYSLQCERIKRRLTTRRWRGIEVGSVETFQGREKKIMIASLVRSFGALGFVKNPRRLNVILSRPMSLLILIGNPYTLGKNKDFAHVIEECKRHGTFRRKPKTPDLLKLLEHILKSESTID